MGCVTIASSVVLINGSTPNLFKSSMGLRQGFPLSPHVFLLVAEGLSRVIIETRRMRRIQGVRIKRSKALTHLLFVDDVLLFCFGSKREGQCFKNIL
jgi:hypothetical protein